MAVAAAFIVASVLIGVNVAVAPEAASGWLIWSIAFAVLALVFWLWIMRDDRAQSQTQVLESTESQLDESESSTQAMLTSAETAVQEADAQMRDAMGDETATVLQVAEAETEKPVSETDPVVESGDLPDVNIPESRAADEITTAAATGDVEALPNADEPDDLTRIEGIGPKYRDALIEMGYDTFDKIAALDYDQLADVLQEAGMRKSAAMETWPEQAKLAAAGEWEALDKLQEALKGGRRN